MQQPAPINVFTPAPTAIAKDQADAIARDNKMFVELMTAIGPTIMSTSMTNLDIQRRLDAVWLWWINDSWSPPAGQP
jgi:hypothetical protein